MTSPTVSKCCQSPYHVTGSNEGTRYFVCDKCGKGCDVVQASPTVSAKDKVAINRLVAEKDAGWALWAGCHNQYSDGTKDVGVAKFTDSADAVLPLLEKAKRWSCRYEPEHDLYLVHTGESVCPYGAAPSFPLAACIALLRAHGVTVTD